MRRDKLAVMTWILIVVTLFYLLFQLARWAYTPDKPVQHNPPSTQSMGFVSAAVVEETTTTTVAPTTTTEALRTTTTRANRGTRRTTTTEVHDAKFWAALANCESEMGRTSRNIFQFSSDTARKVGIDGSESYEVQRAAAITWAARIHPNEGSSSGWPNCWWVALRS